MSLLGFKYSYLLILKVDISFLRQGQAVITYSNNDIGSPTLNISPFLGDKSQESPNIYLGVWTVGKELQKFESETLCNCWTLPSWKRKRKKLNFLFVNKFSLERGGKETSQCL